MAMMLPRNKERCRPVAAATHAESFEQPGAGQQHQRLAVVAADIDPVLGRGQQEAAKYRPAEAEEHFVGVPLHRGVAVFRSGQGAAEDQCPDHRQTQARNAGQRKERAEADQPERMCLELHGEPFAEMGLRLASLAMRA